MRIAEETGDVDEQILGQQVELAGSSRRMFEIAVHVVGLDRRHRHAPLDPALQRALLVEREIMRRLRAQQLDDLRQPVLRRVLAARPSGAARRHPPVVLDEALREFSPTGSTRSTAPVSDRAARHAVIAGLVGILRDDQPAFFLHRFQPGAAVGAGSRKDDANRARGKFLRQRMQQEIERQPRAVTRLRLRKPQGAVLDREIGPRRNDVEMLALDRHAVGGLADLHRRVAGKQIHQHAFMGRIEVLDQNEGEAGVRRQRVQHYPAGVEPPGGGADRHDRKCVGLFGRSRISRRRTCARFQAGFISGTRWTAHAKGFSKTCPRRRDATTLSLNLRRLALLCWPAE